MASMILTSINAAIARHPFASQVGIASTKTALADAIVQVSVEGKRLDSLDYRRSAVFGAFGFAYLGVIQWGIYVRGFRYIFDAKVMDKFCNAPVREKLKDGAGLKQLVQQILLDFVFIQPVIYFPVYYTFKEAIMGSPSSDPSSSGAPPATTSTPGGMPSPERPLGPSTVVANAMDKYGKNFWMDNFGMCGFWLPMDFIIYGSPIHLRLPLNHGISFLWCCLLSIYRGAGDDQKNDEAAAVMPTGQGDDQADLPAANTI
eukprot:g852.t1